MNKISRRQALGIAAGTLTAVGLTVAVIEASATSSPAPEAQAANTSPPAPSIPVGGIDEVYQGRRIQISLGAGGHHSPGMPVIKIDGNELHMMRNADGSWLSVVNHYETFPDPISAARAAVRDLQGAALVPFGPTGGKS
ncbi:MULTISPECIES: tyrosinase cofactor [unclassified Streptomyces]|uniref:apotyrosinase chaperone MelC1 n=1 Tax=unclassified Streptomyces TaxID=2593676 RepID=UPI001BEC5E92|nr:MULTISPECIES: tyrosinase cofactor [unclassified Streptomyces]MBT2408668.1 tyrosinase cofactor [Streptomyces sp. ISL-21]MBT2455546.1 tyrosinase cofactor [Streptomyces sp. ISL-86]MBT2608648.1 tyrosinase cofactor [Streptomyces sp. ISL-87]